MSVKSILIVLWVSLLLFGCNQPKAPDLAQPPKPADNTSVAQEPDEDIVSAQASSKHFGNATASELVSVYDGDTFRVNVDGWPEIIGQNMSIRVNGIDTPERRDKRENIKQLAQAAKEVVVTLLREAESIELRNMQRGKYFRIVADVYVDGNSLADILIKKGLAKPYDGGTKPEWTQADFERYFDGNPN